MLLLILSSYRMSDAESTETILYPMDNNPGHESASASSRTGTPGSVRSRSHSPVHSPPHHRRRHLHRWRQRARTVIGRGRGRPWQRGGRARRPRHGGNGPICGGRGSW